MFRRSRRKIVAAIMTVLALLLLGTLCIIYGFSYYEVSGQNQEMLARYADLYSLEEHGESGQKPDLDPAEKPGPEVKALELEEPNLKEPDLKDAPAFRLSTFYSVALADDGEALAIDNDQGAIYSDEELSEIAAQIQKGGKKNGVKGSLLYLTAEKDGYTLVAFMDNTVMKESVTTLFRYTLVFGGAAILALFFLAVCLARKIVAPLEEGYEKQKQFISDAGHELKTPVSVVSANAELLFREIGENQWLANIQYENQRMGTLVGQMLELARTENLPLRSKSVDFSRLVEGEALPFESLAFEKGKAFHCEIEEGLLIHGDVGQLKQVTAILLDNGIRHCQEGKEIALALRKEHNAAVLSVINDGEAIPAEKRSRIFERFYRADEARTGGEQHYGLGLAIAKAIVTAHKGRIQVRCEDGKVEFTVRIPLKK